MFKSNGSVDDGISDVSNVSAGDVDGSAKPESRNSEPETIAGFGTVSPFDVADVGGEPPADLGSSGTRRRGRPKGSKNAPRDGTQKTSVAASLEGLERLLLSVHLMGATMLHFPELALTPKEAEDLAKATREVAKYYNFNMDPKTMAICQLAMCGAAIYGPRAVVLFTRKPKLKEVSPKVVPIRETAGTHTNGAPPVPTEAPKPSGPASPSMVFGSIPVDPTSDQ